MTEEVREKVSALVDGELTKDEAVSLLKQLNHDVSLRHVWERYHLVKDVLSNELPPLTRIDLVERVKRTISSEPTPIRRPQTRSLPIKPLASLALAASIAVVSVIAFRGYLDASQPEDMRFVQGAAPTSTQVAGMRWDVEHPGVEERLNTYLVNHNGHTGNGMRGMLPYARIVAYNGSR